MKKSSLFQAMVKASIANAFGSGLLATFFFQICDLFAMQTDQLRIYFMNGIENNFTSNTILYRHSQTSILGLLLGCLSLGRWQH